MAKTMQMPDLRGLDPERAASELQALGLLVQTERRAGSPAGKVSGTYPPAGETTTTGSNVVLIVNRHPLVDALIEILPFSS